MKLVGVERELMGYVSTSATVLQAPDSTTLEYAADQIATNREKVEQYLVPMLSRLDVKSVLDVGCGVGVMASELLDRGYDAYGADLAGVVPHWAQQGLPRDRFIVTDPADFRLPFADDSFDFVFSFGVIEHVGTTDGHANREANYHDIRQRWLAELMRVTAVGGHLLVGGPNKNFPVDFAHGPDSRASFLVKKLSKYLGFTVHSPWGDNFLWGYGDLRRYLNDFDCDIVPCRIDGLVSFSRVPAIFRKLADSYIKYLPGVGLGSGLNPWMMGLVKKR